MARTANETKQTQYRLGSDTLSQLDQIAEHLTGLTKTKQSRAAAIRYAAADVAARLPPLAPAPPAEPAKRKKGK